MQNGKMDENDISNRLATTLTPKCSLHINQKFAVISSMQKINGQSATMATENYCKNMLVSII